MVHGVQRPAAMNRNVLARALLLATSACVVEPARPPVYRVAYAPVPAPAPASTPAPAPIQPAPAIDPDALQGVYRVYNGRDHMDALVPDEGGYTTENSNQPLFRTLRNPAPGTIELRRCYSRRTGDHMFSMDAANECPRAGSDHMSVTDTHECSQNRYSIEGGFWAY